MRIMIVGSGGREHALARKIAASPLAETLYIAPGNAGTARLGRNVPIEADNIQGLVGFASQEGVDLVVVGPEIPLSLGLADALAGESRRSGHEILCFGPTKAAAEIESSKPFAKSLMARLGIPSARHAVFTGFEAAAAHAAREASGGRGIVIKAAGLAAGKGVFLPGSRHEAVGILHDLLASGNLGDAGREVLIEERLEGEEISLMAFSDGSRIALMPPSQDHKRRGEGDSGPNTGGMGAYAPAPACPPGLAARLGAEIIEPVVAELALMGRPFVGVIYAGLILTEEGPKVLEFNARFGDPEAEAVLAILDGDIVPTMIACARGNLPSALPRWRGGYAASVVMASPGYPDGSSGGQELSGLEVQEDALASARAGTEVYVLHSGTRLEGDKIVAKPGRVLAVTAAGPSLGAALGAAYARVDRITFPGAVLRRDIGARGLARLGASGPEKARPSAYASSGVDIDAGNEAVALMTAAVRSTYTPSVLAGIGSFGGLYDASALKGMEAPVLVASTDGVGTKVKLAAAGGSYGTVGEDIVNHCIDDILVQGARPLFFLDYFASSRLDPAMVAEAVGGMSAACRASGCVLIGGETAEMPGVYREGEFDVAGAIVGVVERASILPRPGIGPSDLLVGIASDSPHTNGYSLIRKAFDGVELNTVYPELGRPLGEVLLKPHRSYLPLLYPILESSPGLVKGLAHITGGGFIENIPRILPSGIEARVRLGSWPEPPLYGLIRKLGGIEYEEMYRVFNMGIGMVAVVDRKRADELLALIASPNAARPGEKAWIIGELADIGDWQGEGPIPARTRLV